MSRRRSAARGDTIPGTAVKLPRRTTDEIISATSRSVPPVPDQGDLVEHWREAGLLDADEVAALSSEPS